MTRATLLREIDQLEHTVENGFYDGNLDMYFRTLKEWAEFNYPGKNVLNLI